MSALEKLAVTVLFVIAVTIAAVLGAKYYGAQRYAAGYAKAVADGKATFERQAQTYRDKETALRTEQAAKDRAAFKKEQDHAQALEAAQRRVRAGVDSLRCPGTVPAAAAPATGPAAAGPEPDRERPAIVPETAADLLGIAGDVAGLVRRYERLEQRFEECRAVNAK